MTLEWVILSVIYWPITYANVVSINFICRFEVIFIGVNAENTSGISWKSSVNLLHHTLPSFCWVLFISKAYFLFIKLLSTRWKGVSMAFQHIGWIVICQKKQQVENCFFENSYCTRNHHILPFSNYVK